MTDQATRADIFTKLHVKGNPIIIYNAWDGGSAKTIAGCGAKAIATGDHPVGFAHGYGEEDFNDFTFDIYLPTIKEIISRIGDLPFSADINIAYGLDGDELCNLINKLLDAGVIGINYEDQLADSAELQPIEEQVRRIKTIREVADKAAVPLFINARTNIFSLSDKADHASLIDEAISRAKAYQEASANGFFAPGLVDLELIRKLCESVDLPVNIIRLPGTPSTKELAAAGVARISYGPMPQITMTEWLKQQASAALNGEV